MCHGPRQRRTLQTTGDLAAILKYIGLHTDTMRKLKGWHLSEDQPCKALLAIMAFILLFSILYAATKAVLKT
jgi:hypothetical protein